MIALPRPAFVPSDYRVVFLDEEDPTFPDSWGWDEEESAAYMAEVERGGFVVLCAQLQRFCDSCGYWCSTDWDGRYLPTLSDIHLSADDVLDVVEFRKVSLRKSYCLTVARELLAEVAA